MEESNSVGGTWSWNGGTVKVEQLNSVGETVMVKQWNSVGGTVIVGKCGGRVKQ